MKKTIAIVLILTLAISLLAACGGTAKTSPSVSPVTEKVSETVSAEASVSPEPSTVPDSPEPTPEESPEPTPVDTTWQLDYTVDAFGDKTGSAVLSGLFQGTFANTATRGSDLRVVVFFTDSAMLIRLLEYNRTNATYTSRSKFDMSIKVDDKIEDIPSAYISGNPPNSDLFILSRNTFVNYLLDEKEISCVINIDSSKYNFKIDGVGFADLYNELIESAD